jgi:hypothetical protein
VEFKFTSDTRKSQNVYCGSGYDSYEPLLGPSLVIKIGFACETKANLKQFYSGSQFS